jgi:hypothetical protein
MKRSKILLTALGAIAVLLSLLSCGVLGGGGATVRAPGQRPAQHTQTPTIQGPAPQATQQQPPPQATVQPTQEVQVTLGPHPGAHEYGDGETILVNQCFDLVGGETASCSDTAADIKFTFAPGQGGYILPLHELELTAGLQSEPSKATCQAGSFHPLPLEMLLPASNSTGKYYCFHTERGSDIYYGWLQPVGFNSGGLTFNFVTYEP